MALLIPAQVHQYFHRHPDAIFAPVFLFIAYRPAGALQLFEFGGFKRPPFRRGDIVHPVELGKFFPAISQELRESCIGQTQTSIRKPHPERLRGIL